MTDKIEVLDHGFVRLVDHMGSDLSVVRAARVSYDAEWRTGTDPGSDHRLINYLWKNKHTSPFEAVQFTFEVKAPIFVLRQWHRHRTWSYNELSARYRELPEQFYVPKVGDIGVQSTNTKQARIMANGTPLEARKAQLLIGSQCHTAFEAYRAMLADGIPRELARSVLPVATYSHMFASVNLLNLFRFITLRSHEHAQHEIRVYSNAMLELIKPIVPACVEAFEKNQ